MSRKRSLLTPEMQEKVENLVSCCESKDIDILIYCTVRTLKEQARLYRQGRSSSAIKQKIKRLEDKGFDYLGKILNDVGPQYGKTIITNAGPGESWHNYAEAIDAVPIVNGKADWDDYKKYKIYGECAESAGLYWAGNWKRFKEYPHVQFRNVGNPLKHYTPDQVRDLLKKNKLL